jgi:hypothetical protein
MTSVQSVSPKQSAQSLQSSGSFSAMHAATARNSALPVSCDTSRSSLPMAASTSAPHPAAIPQATACAGQSA